MLKTGCSIINPDLYYIFISAMIIDSLILNYGLSIHPWIFLFTYKKNECLLKCFPNDMSEIAEFKKIYKCLSASLFFLFLPILLAPAGHEETKRNIQSTKKHAS